MWKFWRSREAAVEHKADPINSIGNPNPVHIELIAEFGSVHDGSPGNAIKLIKAAAAAGATCVKFQCHLAAAESLQNAPSPSYFDSEDRYAYLERTSFSRGQIELLKSVAEEEGVAFLSSVFSIEAVDLLEDMGVVAHKIPSGEVTNVPLLERVAETGKPVYLSSGMSNWAELDRAIDLLKESCDITVMQCSSLYPCPPERVGLNVISALLNRYDVRVGFSDHTMGLSAAIAAVVLGARVVEKHFTFSRMMYGSDAAHSMEPDEFGMFSHELSAIATMLDHPVEKDDLRPYEAMKHIFEKSVVTARSVRAGTELTRDLIAFKKPGSGISAADYKKVVGRVTARDLPADHMVDDDDLQ